MRNLEEIEGVKKRTLTLLKKLKIETMEDLLSFYPRRYDLHPYPSKIGDVREGKYAVSCLVREEVDAGSNGSFRLYIHDGTGGMTLRWFHSPYIKKMVRPGRRYVFEGNVTIFNGKCYMMQPLFYDEKDYMQIAGSLSPVYKMTKGLSQKTLFGIMMDAINGMEEPQDVIPEETRRKYGLIQKGDAIRCIHYPANMEVAELARKRIVFEEFYNLIYNLKLQYLNRGKNYFRIHKTGIVDKLLNILPYHLTPSQEAAVCEIQKDMEKDIVSSRMVQGDVGSGKTVVAMISMLMIADNGFQSALMAPTEVLATQHYQEISGYVEKLGKSDDFCPILLTGSMKEKEKEEARKKIASGESKMIIGTHALIQDKVEYKDLAMVVIDEQHRFGVEQREALSNKGNRPVHTIIMTATPIPRTTGQILFGAMDVSEMREKPSNRLPIKNCVIPKERREAAYAFLRKEIAKGHQAYIICPMVDEGQDDKANVEGYWKEVSHCFPGITHGLLHGKMTPSEKQAAMDSYADGSTSILIATTVVEVGVNVPNATVILIEDANMFGMLQLHQLRGRVGRGKDQSYCIFINSEDGVNPKLEVLSHSNDGFEIAEADYRLRKAGTLLGNRQSGDMGFKMADAVADEYLLELAAKEAEKEVEQKHKSPSSLNCFPSSRQSKKYNFFCQ